MKRIMFLSLLVLSACRSEVNSTVGDVCFGLMCNQVQVQVSESNDASSYSQSSPTQPEAEETAVSGLCDQLAGICGQWVDGASGETWQPVINRFDTIRYDEEKLSHYYYSFANGDKVSLDTVLEIDGVWTVFDVAGRAYTADTCPVETNDVILIAGRTSWQEDCEATLFTRSYGGN